MYIGLIVCIIYIVVLKGVCGIVQCILGDMVMVIWYVGVLGELKEFNIELFFFEDLIDIGEFVLLVGVVFY